MELKINVDTVTNVTENSIKKSTNDECNQFAINNEYSSYLSNFQSKEPVEIYFEGINYIVHQTFKGKI